MTFERAEREEALTVRLCAGRAGASSRRPHGIGSAAGSAALGIGRGLAVAARTGLQRPELHVAAGGAYLPPPPAPR
eukprot:385274-Rhodomonas_salina.1